MAGYLFLAMDGKEELAFAALRMIIHKFKMP